MQMNTAIPFSGVQPDFVNALAMGQQAAMQRNEASRINALAGLYQTQGADILAGNPNALNALAGIDPMAALGVADARQGMDARALQMDATRQDMQMQAQEWAMRLDERERAQRLTEGEQMLSGMISATSPQAWDAWATSTGQTQLVGQFGQRDTMINNLLPPMEALRRVDAQSAARQEVKIDSKAPAVMPDPQSAIAKLEADYRNGLISEEQYQVGMQSLAPTGMAINVTPGGGLNIAQGPGVQGAVNIPERQSQIQLFGTMMDVAAPVINRIETTYDPSNLQDAAARAMGIPGNFFQSQDGQQYQAAAMAWAEGALRLSTGAAATPQEIQRITETYFARPGDTAETIAFKRQLRAAYESAVVAASGGNFQPGATDLPADPLEFADEAGADVPAEAQAGQRDWQNMSVEDLVAVDPTTLSQEELRTYIARMSEINAQGQ